MLNEFLWAGGLTLQTQALSTKGLATVGGLNICNTIGNISNCIFVTMGTTIAIVVGQLLGAGKLKEAKVTATRMSRFFTFNIIWHDYNSWPTWTCISTFL
ncbi:MAG: MATE family efflux transporter [Eubacterium ventriosum]